MIERYFELENKIELHRTVKTPDSAAPIDKIYFSKINRIIGRDKLEILIPTEQSKYIMLPRNTVYIMVVYTAHGLYQCDVKIIDQYKHQNLYLQSVKLVSAPKRHQRREYYRYNCSIPILCRHLEDEEIEQGVWDQGRPGEECLTLDIGGGGARFISSDNYEEDELVLFIVKLITGGREKKIETFARVVGVKETGLRKENLEVRVRFEGISNDDREHIIQYIFEDERKHKKI